MQACNPLNLVILTILYKYNHKDPHFIHLFYFVLRSPRLDPYIYLVYTLKYTESCQEQNLYEI